jgi:hypothetical protein
MASRSDGLRAWRRCARRARTVATVYGGKNMSRHIASLAAALACLSAAPAIADPDPAAPSLNGARDLQSGFAGDPITIQVRAGGVNRARTIGSQCNGYIADRPDYRITYHPRTGTLPLILAVRSDSDTMLAVRAPDGRWYCDDDSGGGSNPAIRFNRPLDGAYAIFVGTYNEGGNAPAALRISELTSNQPTAATFTLGGTTSSAGKVPDQRMNPDEQPYNGETSLSTGFGSTRRVAVRAGGRIDARSVGRQCTGFAGSKPDYRVRYQAQAIGGKVGSAMPLIFTVNSRADTMLAINGPDGRWYCDDDSGPGTNPLVRFDAPRTGRYDIFVGIYEAGEVVDAELRIDERDGG